jgi:hypothetical protein
LIQEDYDAANPDGEMDEARAVKRSDPADYDWPDPRSILPWITSDHKALFYELFFFGRMVLAECDISPCKHQPVTQTEAILRISYRTALVNALFWSTQWSTQI